MKKTTEITVETHEVTVIRRHRMARRAWCPACAREVEMVTAARAATLTGAGQRAVFRRIEQGELHCLESPGGLTLICLDSLGQRSLLVD